MVIVLKLHGVSHCTGRIHERYLMENKNKTVQKEAVCISDFIGTFPKQFKILNIKEDDGLLRVEYLGKKKPPLWILD